MAGLDLKDFDILSEQEQTEAMALISRYDRLEKQEECQGDFISFVKHMWPECILGRHHRIIGESFVCHLGILSLNLPLPSYRPG